ncbi:DUF2812 domain-containing protein [Streptococcus pneumoniae]|uniref:DUF2812 domain-containing protein n=1 Tax=Streptococcus pneumoniae TaxID=1313 RepID=UPI0005E34C34|nr:DUF2812 domain-containing protein [Streptococcus pneumoniae]MDG7108232.1 DUF2812 domain-containing protein [Streptococcus pneumoniae]MDG7112387.1 DUF2812 domain-containing protein [Streptococcus pneumoniae]MDG7200129.1 DUF2812 domain-containing protein [Streptococcus pneumoniae]MDG9059706.1 DUF2812 domain-containing protein [Streptococcus pneumoniae]MDG9394266.1 DUF2812 domain-containing protein [Streptococcus pneumoniae]
MEKKIVYRIFTIADYEREALYFREMHAKGWELRKVSYSILLFVVKYTFEKCQPEQVFYQLDFYPMEKSERASYLQLFKDCGWEHITDFNSFSYFRKAHSEIESDAEFEIYNDATNKLDMVNRILRLRLVPSLILLAMHMPFLFILLDRSNTFDLWKFLVVGLDIFLSLILLLMVVYISWKLWHKKKELSDL